ncbi:MAG: single-stranded DNA-binding protein [Hominimerdicola sp.]
MLNHFIVMGRLTAEPEVRYTEKDKIPLCRFSIACTRPKRKDSEQETDFFNCVAWRNAAEIVSNYYSKGDIIVIVGQLHNNSYVDKDGKKRITNEVLVKEIHFTGNGKKKSENSEQLPPSPDGLEGLANINLDDFEDIFNDEGVPF